MTATCSICSNPAARDLIDAALVLGERPAQVFDQYGDGLGISRSALYRHARSHVRSSLAPSLLGDLTRGDVVADLSALARSLYESHVDSKASGQTAAAARFGAEARQAFAALLAAGIENENDADMAAYSEEVPQLLGWLLFENRDLFPLAADVARRHDLPAMVEEMAKLPALMAAQDAQTTKKEK